jgi:hypothetical protein
MDDRNLPGTVDERREMMSFLYQERKRRESNISGVVSSPDYSKTEQIPELREKIKKEVNKK